MTSIWERTFTRRQVAIEGAPKVALAAVLASAGGGILVGCSPSPDGAAVPPQGASLDAGTAQVLPTPDRFDINAFRSAVEHFSWEQAHNQEILQFANLVADYYLHITNTTRLSKEQLISNLTFYPSTPEYLEAVRTVYPEYNASQWAYTDFSSGKIFLDLELLRAQAEPQGGSAGMALLDGLWHEWGHLDVTIRNEGTLLNKPEFAFLSPTTNENEPLLYYRGGAVYTETYYGFLFFEEILNESLTIRLMTEKLGMQTYIAAADYYPLGAELFVPLSQKAGVSVDELYELHSTSNFEALATKIGSVLPGGTSDLDKGVTLFIGLHQQDEEVIRATGVYEILNK